MKKDQVNKMKEELENQIKNYPHMCCDWILERQAKIRLNEELDNVINEELKNGDLTFDDIVSVVSDLKNELLTQRSFDIAVYQDEKILKRVEKIEMLERKQEILNETKMLSGKA